MQGCGYIKVPSLGLDSFHRQFSQDFVDQHIYHGNVGGENLKYAGLPTNDAISTTTVYYLNLFNYDVQAVQISPKVMTKGKDRNTFKIP